MEVEMKKGSLSARAEARRHCDNLAHLIRSNFVGAKPEKFTSDVLNLAHAQTKPHQLGAERHQATAHQPSETTAIARARDRSFRARNLVDQDLNFVGGSLVANETQNVPHTLFITTIITTPLHCH